MCKVASTAYTADRAKCLACDATTAVWKAAANDCECKTWTAVKVVAERDSGGALLPKKKCAACPAYTYTTASTDKVCLPCPAPGVEESKQPAPCKCTGTLVSTVDSNPGGAFPVNLGGCVIKARAEDDIKQSVREKASKIDLTEFGLDSSFRSLGTFERLFLPSAVYCRDATPDTAADDKLRVVGAARSRQLEACQTLANLCALQFHSGDSSACQFFTDTDSPWSYTKQVGAPNFPPKMVSQKEWTLGVPWVMYPPSSNNVRKGKTLVKSTMSFDADTKRDGYVNKLKFVLGTYSLEGKFLGFEDLTTQLDMCSGLPAGFQGDASGAAWSTFGYSLSKSCTHKPSRFLDPGAAAPKFYDLYLVDEGNNNKLVSVPVKVLNYRKKDDTERYNSDDECGKPGEVDSGDFKCTEQLMRRFFLYDTATGIGKPGEAPQYLQYAKSVKLSTRLFLKDSLTPKIYPPVLTIEYGAIGVDDAADPVAVSFVVECTSDLYSWWHGFALLWLIVFSVLSGLSWFTRLWLMSKNRPSTGVDLGFLIRALLEFCGAGSNCLFGFMFLMTAYWFIFFKGQSVVYSLLPSATDEGTGFTAVLIVMFCLKVCDIMYVIFKQSTIDMFFIDWEKTKGRLMTPDPETNSDTDGNCQVSIWRTLFIANEFNELQTARMVSTEFTLIVMVYLLEGRGWSYYATSQPDGSDLSAGGASVHPALRFFVDAALYMAITGAQMMYMQGIHHRFIHNPVDGFLDLLTLANMSAIFIVDKYGGFYCHGQAPHPFMDVDMLTMARNLEQEQQGRRAKRGIMPGDPCLTFEIFINMQVRDEYENEMKLLDDSSSMRGDRQGLLTNEKTVRVYQRLNRMFRDLILSEETGTAKYAHKFVDMTPAMRIFPFYKKTIAEMTESHFFKDEDQRFSSVVFYGIEKQLMIANVVVLSFFHFYTDSTIASLVIVYAFHLACNWMRERYGTSNIARKCIVDEKFLV